MGPNRWIEVTASEFPHEREALAFLREGLPDREPFRAWSNFTIVGNDGRLSEIDAPIVSPTGVHLVEIKNYRGTLTGDAGTWTQTRGKHGWTMDNPLPLADRKAKILKSLLLDQPAFRAARGGRLYVQASVFLSNPGLNCQLDELGRTAVYGRDPTPGPRTRAALPGIIEFLARVDPRHGARVDASLSRGIAQAMGQAGIRQSTAMRRVGAYELEKVLADGDDWQDHLARHTNIDRQVRIRIYLSERSRPANEQAALRRAARREFELLRNLRHPGIDTPFEYMDDDRGPALLFDHDAKAKPLDLWLADRRDELDLLDRIGLVRQLAETLRFAHRQGLSHRALTPRCIMVSRAGGRTRLRIRDWHAGARRLGSTSSGGITGTALSHVHSFVPRAARLYLAPELSSSGGDAVNTRAADLFSLGAVAFLILTGQPPAPDLDTLRATLREQGKLSLAAAQDGALRDLDVVIGTATEVDASVRLVSVEEFLEYLDIAEELLTRPEEPDPIEAVVGQRIAGAWTVKRRFGSGSTSVVLLAERDGRDEVLKIARDAESAERLRDEFEVLRTLRRSWLVVEAFELVEVVGRTVLVMEPAKRTLAAELEQHGRCSLDFLQRWGHDLVEVVGILEDDGVSHRDLKPANLGITERGRNHELHLVLFDFSLARTDPANLTAGTAGYLDPFLSERRPPRWDVHGERYAAAVTLYEMATGTRPVWGDGSTDVTLRADLVLPCIDEDLFDLAVREPLAAFFGQALHRDPRKRFDTAADMLRAWDEVFTGLDRARRGPDEPLDADQVDLTTATPATPLLDLGLPPRVLSVLERLRIATVADLRELPPSRLVVLGGIGLRTRQSVTRLAERIRECFPDAPARHADRASIDSLAALLAPKPPANQAQRTAIAALLGLDGEPLARWPEQRAVAERLDTSLGAVAAALARSRDRWRRAPAITEVRHDLVELLRNRECVASGGELAADLLSLRGSLVADPVRSQRARAVVRAAAEAEATLDGPRFVVRRVGAKLVVALDGELAGDDGPELHDGAALLEAAARLGPVADAIAAEVPLATPERALARLREVELPEEAGLFSDVRLVRLAAAVSSGAAVSARLEFYPVGMPPRRAVEEARAALLDRRGLEPGEVADRVRARFPEAAQLPRGMELAELLADAGTGLVLGPDGRFVPEQRDGLLSTRRSTTGHTSFGSPDEREAAVGELEERLARLERDGGFLALTVSPRRLREAAAAVAEHAGGTVVDLDRLLVTGMRRVAEAKEASWERLLEADAADRASRPWRILAQLAAEVVSQAERQLLDGPPVTVAVNLGLLARYGHLDLLDRLRDRLTRESGDQPLRALVVLAPGEDPTARPMIDGQPVPVLTANQWAHAPRVWLDGRREKGAA